MGFQEEQGGVPLAGGLEQDIPLGFGMGLVMNQAAMNGYAGLTEAEKEEVILRCKSAKTKAEMQGIIDSLAPGIDVQQVYEEEKESFL